MSKGKIALITVLFALATFVVPILILLMFASVNDYLGSVYLIVFGTLLFASFGFLFAMLLSTKKEISEQIEELKVQNAAIAFRLSEMKKQGVLNKNDAPIAADVKAEPKKQEKFDDFQ